MNMIVFLAIALLILVLVVTFATGGISKLFGGLTTTGPSELETVKNNCQRLCDDAKLKVDAQGYDVWETTPYCTERMPLDVNGDGEISEDEYLACSEDPINVICTKTIRTPTGELITCTAENGECSCTAA